MKTAVRIAILAVVVGAAATGLYVFLRPAPEPPAQPRGEVALIDAGGHSCAVTTGGGVRCWGNNKDGQLGVGDTRERVYPSAVSGLDSGIRSVSVGSHATCALSVAGDVRCWGLNSSGQIGDKTTKTRTKPVPVSGLSSGVAAISVGGDHACALSVSGAVSCWGKNRAGQLGDGTTKNRTQRTRVSGLTSGVTAIAAGASHTCALSRDGKLRCWGENSSGQLGNGGTKDSRKPSAVTGLKAGVVAVTAGGNHTCALLKDGAVRCWGDNRFGQVGDGTTKQRPKPAGVKGLSPGVLSVAAGSNHTCAVETGGILKCWGRNSPGGPLGDGTLTDRHQPVEVSGLGSGVRAVAAGASHTCAVTNNGFATCWGSNDHGQLGDGTPDRLPQDVVWR